MKNEFYSLYNKMANSQTVDNMHTFGQVHKEMMEWMIQNKPDLAQEWIEKLSSIKWNNFLTPKEAEKIVAGMQPKAPWTRDAWRNAMNQLGLPMDEEPYYNSCALWVEMNKLYSDHAATIARNILKKSLNEVPMEQLVTGMHALALDNLKDADGVYNIRIYFGV